MWMVITLGKEPIFYVQQSIFLTIPDFNTFEASVRGMQDAGGYTMVSGSTYESMLAWSFLGTGS